MRMSVHINLIFFNLVKNAYDGYDNTLSVDQLTRLTLLKVADGDSMADEVEDPQLPEISALSSAPDPWWLDFSLHQVAGEVRPTMPDCT